MGAQIKKSEKLWTKYFIFIMVYNLLTMVSNYMLVTGIPLYAMHLGGNKSIAGLMMGVFMVAAILFRPFFGMLLDNKSRRMVLIIGAAICILIYFSYLLVFSVGMLLFLRALNGIGFSANTNASGTVVSDIVPRSRLAEGVGYFGIANTLATAIGPALSLFIIKNFDYKVLFWTVFAIGIISLGCSFFINYEKMKPKVRNKLSEKGENSPNRITIQKKLATAIFEKTALPTSLVIIFVATTMGSIMTFLPTYAATRGIEDISVYFTVYAATLLLTRFFAGKLADRYGYSIVILPGMLLMILSFVILSFASSLPVFLASAVLYGFGYGSVQPTLNAIMIRFCPVERRGVGNSTFFTAMDIGSGGGAVLWGIISQNSGFTWVYLGCAASVVIALTAYVLVLNKQIKNKKSLQAAVTM